MRPFLRWFFAPPIALLRTLLDAPRTIAEFFSPVTAEIGDRCLRCLDVHAPAFRCVARRARGHCINCDFYQDLDVDFRCSLCGSPHVRAILLQPFQPPAESVAPLPHASIAPSRLSMAGASRSAAGGSRIVQFRVKEVRLIERN